MTSYAHRERTKNVVNIEIRIIFSKKVSLNWKTNVKIEKPTVK